ncbi:MAG: inosine/xanthosine triphosphatase [Candidatus Micrarchaeota archaeon]
MFGRVVLGGTFEVIHAGHSALLSKAFSIGARVLIGLTSDGFARRRKKYKIRNFAARKKKLVAFLGENARRAEILKIEDKFGPAARDAEIDAIVVSAETETTAREINERRARKKLKKLEIVVVPIVYAEDLKRVSCERVLSGEIDERGKRLKPLRIALGSTNPNKINGVRAVAKKIFPFLAHVEGVRINSCAGRQPFGKSTIGGAVERAGRAHKKLRADYGVGLESGLFEFGKRYFDFLWCAVHDGEQTTLGCSMGFEVPRKIVERIKRERSDMGDMFSEIAGIEKIGEKGGALGFLSRGLAGREEMVQQAFLCAMLPRISARVYR